MNISILGQNIRTMRESKKMSISKLSKEAGVGLATIHEIESGVRQNLRSGTIEKIAKALDVNQGTLITPIEEREYVVEDIFETLNLILSSEELTLDNEAMSFAEKELLIESIKDKLNEILVIRRLLRANDVDESSIKSAKELISLRNEIVHGGYKR